MGDGHYCRFADPAYHDWRYFVQNCRTFYSYGCELTGHDNGCRCEYHAGYLLSQEIGTVPDPTSPVLYDLQQFSTGYKNAFNIANVIVDTVGDSLNFIELGAGNGVLSAHLIMRGMRGTAVEIDMNSTIGRLKAWELELPFSGEIPLIAALDSVGKITEDSGRYDFVVMNPPFYWETFNMFLDKAFLLSEIVFCVIPTDKIPDALGNGVQLANKLKKANKSIYPLIDVPIKLLKTRGWHQRKSYQLHCQLCLILDKSSHFTFGDMINAEELDEKRNPGLYVPQDADDLQFILPSPDGYVGGYNHTAYKLSQHDLPSYYDAAKTKVVPKVLSYAKDRRLTNLIRTNTHCHWVDIQDSVPVRGITYNNGVFFIHYGEHKSELVLELRNKFPRFYKCSHASMEYFRLVKGHPPPHPMLQPFIQQDKGQSHGCFVKFHELRKTRALKAPVSEKDLNSDGLAYVRLDADTKYRD